MGNRAGSGARGDVLFSLLLIASVLIVYAPSVDFGLVWDDPAWYQQGAGLSAQQIFSALPTYQFYRPVGILLNRLLTSPDGTVNVPLAHLIQIGAHLAATLLSVPVLRILGFDVRHARLSAVLFAVYPLSYQAVAWQAPLQPLAMVGVLTAVLAADVYVKRRRAAMLALSLASYVTALLIHESAVPFVFLPAWIALRDWRATSKRPWWFLFYLGLTGLYVLIWLSVPRRADVTGAGFQSEVLGYLLQGIVFPLAHVLTGLAGDWPLAAWITLFAMISLVLALAIFRWRSQREAALACLWIAAGILPVWAGLSWSYVRVGSRLLYPASLGIAALWAGWAVWLFETQRTRRLRALGLAALIASLGSSYIQLEQFQRLRQIGTEHLAQAVEALADHPDQRLLFVNFPDRMEIRPPLYPLGFWGMTLAPIGQRLSDFAEAETGESGEGRSLSVAATGADERAAWPYRVDMRGVNIDPAALFEAAHWADRVYLTDYLPGGELRLRWVGQTRAIPNGARLVARFGDSVELAGAELSIDGEHLVIRLEWNCVQPLPANDTVFVHVWKDEAFLDDADGDSLGGLLPLWAWQPDTQSVDVRQVPLAALEPGRYRVTVGLYNRVSGARYPAVSGDQNRFPDDEVPVGELRIP